MAKVLSTPDLRAISSPARAQRSPARAFRSPGRALRSPSCRLQGFRSPAREGRAEDASAGSVSIVSQCRIASSTAARGELQAGIREVRRERVRAAELRNELQSTKELFQDAQREKAESAKLRETMLQAAAASESRLDSLECTCGELEDAHEQQVRELQLEEDALKHKRDAAEQRAHEVRQFLGMYERRLGLSIEITAPETVKFIFKGLHPEDCARECSFVLGLVAGDASTTDTYSVTGCSPSIPNLRSFVSALNKEAHTNTAVPTFLCAVRQGFKNVATGSKAVQA